MPNIENLEKKPFINSRDNLLNVRRGEILYREDLTTGFVFVVVGTTISLAVAGTIYVVVPYSLAYSLFKNWTFNVRNVIPKNPRKGKLNKKRLQKEKDNELSQKISQDLKNNEELVKSLLENFKGELEKQKEKNNALTEKITLSLDKNESLIKLRLENLSTEMKNNVAQPLEKINSILLHPFQRGKLGNSQLDQLLSLYLPKDHKVYQIEFSLKKKRANGDGLRVDAIVFGVDGKNNIAIDSKFPLENYLLSADSKLTKEQREEFEKKFKNDLKNHIKKVAEYISELDSTKHAIMFVPSEVIFAKINENNFYEIIELALEKKVTICSPILLNWISFEKTLTDFKEGENNLLKAKTEMAAVLQGESREEEL
ncbi:794_t:CDS:2 [Entrophospora sp. SA101]|nr:794_t:CDS:2 [Entrophospora sp. SA101]